MILVVGATGLLGGMITRKLLAQGHQVRILVRPGRDVAELVAAGAQPVLGDLKDRASLDAACKDIEVVITTANAVKSTVPEDNLDTVDRQGSKNLIDASKQAKVSQFIYTSVSGPEMPFPIMQVKAEIETYLKASGLPYTILNPDVFVEVWGGMIVGVPLQAGLPVSIVGEGNVKHLFVATSNVADFAVAAVCNPAATNKNLWIGGPEKLTWRELIAVFGKVVGHSLPVQSITADVPMPGFPPDFGALLSAFFYSMEHYPVDFDALRTAKAFDVSLIPMEEAIRNMLGQPVA